MVNPQNEADDDGNTHQPMHYVVYTPSYKTQTLVQSGRIAYSFQRSIGPRWLKVDKNKTAARSRREDRSLAWFQPSFSATPALFRRMRMAEYYPVITVEGTTGFMKEMLSRGGALVVSSEILGHPRALMEGECDTDLGPTRVHGAQIRNAPAHNVESEHFLDPIGSAPILWATRYGSHSCGARKIESVLSAACRGGGVQHSVDSQSNTNQRGLRTAVLDLILPSNVRGRQGAELVAVGRIQIRATPSGRQVSKPKIFVTKQPAALIAMVAKSGHAAEGGARLDLEVLTTATTEAGRDGHEANVGQVKTYAEYTVLVTESEEIW
ncbi:hypothetical protein R3P38DRAFT_2812275 [Favolaschia claudopus]|uniref:Uncharacterized protein n=1 Tax=Favolaschia claudopus TaxID=2862362 RepID=A0AAV9Z8J3_9AGAR